MSTPAEAAEFLLDITEMDAFKDLTSELVVTFLVTQKDLPDEKKENLENFHWSMTMFFNKMISIQEARRAAKNGK